MLRFTVNIIFLLLFFNLYAQQPNDCVNSILVCGNANFSSNATGIGNTQEVTGCSGFEHNSLWIKINIVRTGTLGFNLIPNNPSITVDYDFWVYGPNRACNNLGSPIRCCTTNPQQAGLTTNLTGMNGSTAATTSGPGANGNGYVRWLDVVAGQSYYIAIDRPEGDGGFELQWIGSTMDTGGAFPTPPTANTIPEYRTCSVTPNVGIFDLNTVRTQINSDITNNTITFHTTLADATDGINPLPNIYGNTSNPQTIYAKVKNNTSGCSTITTFQLKVYPVPDATITASATTVCANSNAIITFTGTPNAVVEFTVNGGAIQSATLNASGTFQITETITNTLVYRLVGVKTLSSDNTTTLCSRNKNITVTINVSNPPVPTVVTNSPICYDGIGVLTFNGLSNATLSYTINGGASQSVVLDATGQQQVNLTGLTAGTYTILITDITEATAPNCTTNTNITTTLIVQPQPTVTISANNSVCLGTSATVNFTGTPNATITFTVDGGPIQTITLNTLGTASIITPVLTADTTYQLVSISTATTSICTSTLSGSATILVTGLPTVSISGTTTICSGNSSIITFSGSPGAIVTYTVNGGSNQTIILDATGNASLTTPVLTNNTTYDLVNVTTTCSNSASGSATITILSLPTATISNNITICSGTSATILFNGSADAIVTYTVDGGPNQTIVLNSLGTATLITPILTTNSNYTLVSVASATSPICNQLVSGSSTIIVQALPTATVSANTICFGNTGTVIFTGTPNATLTYNVDGGINQTILLNASGVATLTTPVLTANSTYQLISITTNTTPICSQNLSMSATVQITGLPTATISGTTTICSGNSATIYFSGTPNATVTYTVNGGANQTIILDATGIATLITPSLLANTTYALIDVNGVCSNTATGNATITILPLPTAVITAPTICSGTTATIQFSGTPNAILTYSIDGGVNQTITLNALGNASVISPILTSNSTYNLVSVASPSSPICTQMLTVSATVNVLLLPTVTVSANTICSGNTGTVIFTGTPNAIVTYNVDGGINQTILLNASGVATLTTPVLITNSTYQLISITSSTTPICSQSLSTSATVQVTGLPTASISGTTTICSGGNTIISFSGTPNAVVNYLINGTLNQTITLDASGVATLSTPNLTSDTTYSLTSVMSSCSNLVSGLVTITVLDLPTASITAPLICNGDSGIVTFSGTPNSVVTFFIDGGINQDIVLNSSGIAFLPTPILTSNSTYTIVSVALTTATSSCSQSLGTETIITVAPIPDVIITPALTTICSGTSTSINLSSSVSDTTYSWVVSGQSNVTGAFDSSGTIISQVLTATSGINSYVDYLVTPTANGCVGPPVSIRINVSPSPTVIPNNINSTFCSGGSTNIQLGSNVPGAVYSWTVTGGNVIGASGGSGASSINQVLTTSAGTTSTVEVVYTIIAEANGCAGPAQVVRVYVTPIPNVVVSSNPTPICSGTSTNISLSGSIPGTIYNWVVTNATGVSGATNGTGTVISQLLTATSLSQGTVTYQITPTFNGCTGASQSVTVLVNPKPELFADPTHPPMCSGVGTTNIVVSTFNTNTIFDWVVIPVGVSGASSGSFTGLNLLIQQALTTTGTTQGYVDYIITPRLSNCKGDSITIRVYVNPLPVPVLEEGAICVDEFGVPFQSYTLDSGLDNATYDFVWYFNGVALLNSNNATYTATAVGTYGVIATNSTTNCASSTESNMITVNVTSVVPASMVTVTQTDYFSDNATLIATVTGGTGTLLYSLDEGALQSSNVFTNVSAGAHTLTVIDTQGCTHLTYNVFVIGYPQYFTPNGDGINDTWFIAGLQTTDVINIFDRYGKFLKQLKGEEYWDGTYNQAPLPSTDYWFTVDYIENGAKKQFKAHFAMKR